MGDFLKRAWVFFRGLTFEAWMYISILFILVLLPLSCVFGEGLEPAEANELSFRNCLHPDSKPIEYAKSNMASIATICEFCFHLDRQVVLTSTCRPDSKGQHGKCNAYDFYCDYDHLNGVCDVHTTYLQDADALIDWLKFTGWDDIAGVGIYHNLTHHVDFRGHKALWGFMADKTEVPYAKVRHDLEDALASSCEEQ